MYLFYIDESGNTGSNLTDPDHPVHWLVAVGVEETQIPHLEDSLSDLAEEVCGYLTARDPRFEFHGSKIFHGGSHFSDLSPQERVDLYRSVIRLLEEFELPVWVRGIHKQRHHDRAENYGYDPDHPHQLGFMYLVESIDRWLLSQQPDEDESDLYGLLVADEQKGIERDIIHRFPRWREHGTDHGYKPREIEYLVDTVHTVPSHDSWMIQLADCVAYIRNREYRGRREDDGSFVPREDLDASGEAVREIYGDICAPQVHEHRLWPTQ